MHSDRIKASLYGLAYGDAIGALTEFSTIEEIKHRFPPNGPMTLIGDPARVTDDTQMALAVGEALMECSNFSPQETEQALRQHFVKWFDDPENNRAPGRTCLTSCQRLKQDLHWHDATDQWSKGCGANMRVTPIGLLSGSQETRSTLAQFQSALTHANPTALAASDLTAYTVTCLLQGVELDDLINELRHYAMAQKNIYYEDWLGTIWTSNIVFNDSAAFIAKGWQDCLNCLDRLEDAVKRQDRLSDPCLATGEGWVAEEALATGLLCFMLFPQDGVLALNRAAVTKGDSDSIACLTGAFSGAFHGMHIWPTEWQERIEYRERLDKLSDYLSGEL